MSEQYWNAELTEKSWSLLHELRKKYKFVLIGGWAVYLWTQQQKSKDIDIVVEIGELQKLKNEKLAKNDRLKKYEIKYGDIDVDIYVEHFSELALGAEKISKYATNVEGFSVARPEALLILKQGAELERRNSVKGEKDRIDIMSLLFFCDFDYGFYKQILAQNLDEGFIDELIGIVLQFADYNQFNMAPREFKIKKAKILESLKKL